MINIHCRLAQQSVPLNFRRPRQHPGAGLYRLLDDVRPVLQVHDELVFEVREEHLSAVRAVHSCSTSLPTTIDGWTHILLLSTHSSFYL